MAAFAGLAAPQPRRSHCVAHQHGDGERSNAAGNRSERAGRLDHVGMDVAHEDRALLAEAFDLFGELGEDALGLLRVGDDVLANVNHYGAWANVFGGDHSGAAHGHDDDICAANDVFQIARLRVADRHRRIGVHEKKGHRFAHDIAASHDHGVGAFKVDAAAAGRFP